MTTDFTRTLPAHVAAEICGHTEQVALERYRTVSDSDLDQAIAELSQVTDKSLPPKGRKNYPKS